MFKTYINIKVLFSVFAGLALVSCASDNIPRSQSEGLAASGHIQEKSGAAVRGNLRGQAKGEVIFTKAPDGKGVKMIVNAKGLKDKGFHAVHIHQMPVCEGDFKTAGGHFNPEHNQHGHPEERSQHVGDLGNFKADKNGVIVEEKLFTHLSLDPNDERYVGDRSLVIHAKADDYSTQPTGGAGSRLGCAVLQRTAE